jgi:hypothetical protein
MASPVALKGKIINVDILELINTMIIENVAFELVYVS